MNMTRMTNTRNQRTRRDGNVLVGCLVALGLAIILIIIATVFVVKSWRGWASTGLKQGITAMLDESQIEQGEKNEINAHINSLMTRFENKDISIEDLGLITKEVFEGPLLPVGIVAASYEEYITDSELEDEIKADAKIQLARVAHGMYTEAITMEQLDAILDPISASALSGNSAVHVQTEDFQLNLKDPENVTIEELTLLIANARTAADEAEIDEVAPAIDLSDEVGKAIANALGEDPALWLEPAEEAEEDVEP